MPLPWDPEVLAALSPLLEATGRGEPAAVGDVARRRSDFQALAGLLRATAPAHEDVAVTHHDAVSFDGATVPMRRYRPPGAEEGPLWVWLHGGGMILGCLDDYDPLFRSLAAGAGRTLLAPEYRLAPEHPHPVPVEDCYAALRWAADHARELGSDPARIGLAGDSAGGGLAAGVALMARDRGGPPVARQLLVYPMLDDRSLEPDPQIAEALSWTYDDNRTGWGALLGDLAGAATGVSPYAAPARAVDLSGLPPAYIDVGGLDLFRDEDIDYARRLGLAGVPAELHVLPGVPHAFELLAPGTEAAARVVAGRFRFLRGL